ncbi:MAG: hypothetical protein KGJ13_00020 [Patescibacteria group bacterium]|nr:hypothetical protein [Patescibacteria group bacterium]
MSAPTLKPVKAVVLPNHPTIDKLIALWRVKHDLQKNYRFRLAFCDVNVPTPEHYRQWNALCSPGVDGPYLLDVGEKKYHITAGSASAVEKMASPTQQARTWNMLAELASKNNQNAFLKSLPNSIVKVLRELYEVASSQEVVIDHAMEVIDGFFLRRNGRNWEDLFINPEFEEIRKLWEGFNIDECEVKPFTLQLYFRQLFLAGRSPNEISEKIGWWLRKRDQVRAARVKAEKKAYKTTLFSVDNRPCILAEVKDVFEGQAAFRRFVGSGKFAIGIVRNTRLGHVTIQASARHYYGVNFDALANALAVLEPGLWYYETRFASGPILMNGSPQYTGVRRTSLSDDMLIYQISHLVDFSK